MGKEKRLQEYKKEKRLQEYEEERILRNYDRWMAEAVSSMESFLNSETEGVNDENKSDNLKEDQEEIHKEEDKILYRMVDGAYQRTLLNKENAQVSYNLVSPTPVPTMRYLGYRRTETHPYLRYQDQMAADLDKVPQNQDDRTFVTKTSEGI